MYICTFSILILGISTSTRENSFSSVWIEEEYGKLSIVEEPGEVIRPRGRSGWSTAVVPLPTPDRMGLVIGMLDVDRLRDIAFWTSVSMVLSDLHICVKGKWRARVTWTVSCSLQVLDSRGDLRRILDLAGHIDEGLDFTQ